MENIDVMEFMKSLVEKSDEGIVEMALLGREAYVAGLYDCIIGEFNSRRLDPDLLKEKGNIEKAEIAERVLNIEKFKTIALFDMPGLVKIYQDALEQEWITTFVPNDYAPYDGQILTKPNPVDRSVKLQVQTKDIKRAIEILNEDPACQKYIVYLNKDSSGKDCLP